MRPHTLLLLVTLLGWIAAPLQSRQGKAEDPTTSKIDSGFMMREGANNPIFVRFEDQLFKKAGDYEAWCEKNRGKGRRSLRKLVIETLKKKQKDTLTRLTSTLGKMVEEGKLPNWKRYWIVNGFAARADGPTIEALAAMKDVAFVYRMRAAPQYELPRRRTFSDIQLQALTEFDKKWKSDAEEPFSAEGLSIPWNVERIQAPEVWKRGHLGQGVVVALLDTGLLPADSLTRALWRNPGETPNGRDDDHNGFVDDLYGWNFQTNHPFMPGDSGRMPHGSICGGIIAGRPYNEKKLITGLAPRARIMVLQGMGQLGAYEYALENGADLLSMSYMWVNMKLGNYRGVFRLAHEHLAAGGIVACGGAGNFGPGSRRRAPAGKQIALPKDIPCVIAAAGLVESGERSPASSEGPCTWDDVVFYEDYPPSNPLQKPDVTGFFGGYPVWCRTNVRAPNWKTVWEGPGGIGLVVGPRGNSFSGPHAVGVSALMLSANPDLLPIDVQAILRATAKDLGPKGWDKSYGTGLMQALPAVLEAEKRAGKKGGKGPARKSERSSQPKKKKKA